MPTFPSIMIEAAANPVSSEIWAFQDSTGEHLAVLEAPPVVLDVDLLRRHRQRHPTALSLLGYPQLTDGLSTAQRRPSRSTVDLAPARP